MLGIDLEQRCFAAPGGFARLKRRINRLFQALEKDRAAHPLTLEASFRDEALGPASGTRPPDPLRTDEHKGARGPSPPRARECSQQGKDFSVRAPAPGFQPHPRKSGPRQHPPACGRVPPADRPGQGGPARIRKIRSASAMASTGSWVTSRHEARVSRSSARVSARTEFAQPLIQPRERLVHQQHLRPRHQGAGQRHALLLAPRQLMRKAFGMIAPAPRDRAP